MLTLQLTQEQRAAVEAREPRVLVLAGAGSGKTRVLTQRVRHLMEHRLASPHEILCLTFTRAAANEMRERIEKSCGPRSRHVTVGTMHGIGLGLIRRFGEFLGLRGNTLSVYNEKQAEYLLKDIATDLGLYNGKTWKKVRKGDVDAMFDRFDQTGEEPGPDAGVLHTLFKTFVARCRESNAMTYAWLIHGLELLVNQGIVHKYTNWKYVLVDEVQDIDARQWRIIEALSGGGFDRELFAVGDVDQSIFQWRGAVPEYLIQHRDTFTIYPLQDNFRSEPRIVIAANRLIQNNSMRLEKTMRPALEASGREVILRYQDTKSQHIAVGAKNFAETGGRITVLARTHALLKKVSQELDLLGVKHVYVGKDSGIFQLDSFVRVHALLNLAVNPYDDFSFMLARPFLGPFPEIEYSSLRLVAASRGVSHFQVWMDRNGASGIGVVVGGEERVLSAGSDMTTVADVVRAHASDAQVQGDWTPVYLWLAAFAEKYPTATLGNYLDWIATFDVQDGLPEDLDREKVILMTIHGSKGLEFDTVLLAGLNEGMFPGSKCRDDARELEAERRLAYVAVTRAMRRLVLTTRPVEDGEPSRFIAEMFNN